MKKSTRAAVLVALTAALAPAGTAVAADGAVKVDQDAEASWLFNRDASTSTPYSFTLGDRSIGGGSLEVAPITNTTAAGQPEPKDKFVAEQFLAAPVSDVSAIAYDFRIAGPAGDAGDADDFYLNVYTNLPGSTTYYDCRFDYVPAEGSTTQWTTAAFGAGDTPAHVQSRGGASCPATLGRMVPGSTISFFSLNVGQSSASDTGLGGFLDNVAVSRGAGTTVYDLEPPKSACKEGGFAVGGFANQGLCIAAVLNG